MTTPEGRYLRMSWQVETVLPSIEVPSPSVY
jgi:hypothetical protein